MACCVFTHFLLLLRRPAHSTFAKFSNKRKIMRIPAILLLAAHTAAAAHAQDSAIYTYALADEVVITAARTPKRLSNAPVLTTLIRSEEIRRSASVSALETLQDNLPGLASAPIAGMGSNLRLHGLSSRYILFLVDGERLVGEGADGSINLEQIDIGSIQRIEIVGGAASALYGSGAMAAVINLITKQPHSKAHACVSQSIESNNTLRSRIEAASALPKASIKASAMRNASDGFSNANSGVTAARYEDYGADIKASYTPAKPAAINISSRWYSHEVFNAPNALNVKHDYTQTFSASGSAIYMYAPADTPVNTLRLSAYWDKYFDYDIFERIGNKRSLQNTASYLSLRLVDTYIPMQKLELTAGSEYNIEENYALTTMGPSAISRQTDDINAFMQAEYTAFSALTIVGGGRYTYNSQFGNALSPKLSLMYKIGSLRMRSGIGYAFRAPAVKELYYNFNHQGMFYVYGNPDLLPERGLLASLSAEYSYAYFNASITAYYNNINNKITQYDVIGADGNAHKHYKNTSGALLRGADIEMQYVVYNRLVLRGAYSFCDAYDRSDGSELQGSIRHSAALSAVWNGSLWRSPFSLGLYARLSSPMLYWSANADVSAGADAVQLVRSKAYSIFKAVLTKTFKWKQHLLELTFKVDNIFNFHDVSFVDSGRKYLAGIRYSFTYD
jgi:outer membrane receptor for ferrienterochelin and colicins